jgi:hypothetical protein
MAETCGESSPTATDLQNLLATLDRQELFDPLYLCPLGLFQTEGRFRVQCGGIGHARIEPLAVEGIAEVVMIGYVLPTAGLVVRAQNMAKSLQQSDRQAT